MAAGMMRNPSASLPEQMGSHKALKAAYRFLKEEEVSFPALLKPHVEQTLQAACKHPVVLMVQDTTHVDYTHHPSKTGWGPIGDGKGRGFLLQTGLAVVPLPRQVLGIASQEPFIRQKAPEGEACKQRQRRPRESQGWSRAVQRVGDPSQGCLWVHVGDRDSDLFEGRETCRQRQSHFLIRAAQNRRVKDAVGRLDYLFSFVRALPALGKKVLDLPARHGQPARQACVPLSFAPVTLQPPPHSSQKAPLASWGIRVWEPDPPAEVEHPLEWVLLTSVETQTLSQAWERVQGYTCRWGVEDYPQCLKTGCRIEKRQLQQGERLFRLLGFLAPVAVRLLQGREMARLTPQRLACEERSLRTWARGGLSWRRCRKHL